ncbi:MAG: ABC transporter ATP-binding protein [Candidatus Saccharimonadales bacterium]
MSEQSGETIIRLSGVTKRYGFGDSEYFALRDFDLTVKRGEFIMVMGPSGCGKTTLLNIIGLLDKATAGEYVLGGKNVERISARKQAKFRARQIGFIFQNFNLIPTLPVIENVALPLAYAGFHKTRRLRMASNILDHFHLQEREYYMPWQLSGGQQQRVAIARSLVANPSIILADEPTGNLDSRSSHIVMEELRDIHSMGNTIIMVTHNPALTTYATRVINMLDGEIDTDIKTVADRDLPKPGDPEKISVRILSKKRGAAVEADKTETSSDTSKESEAGASSSSSPLSSQKTKSTQDTSKETPKSTQKKKSGKKATKSKTAKKNNGKKIGVK